MRGEVRSIDCEVIMINLHFGHATNIGTPNACLKAVLKHTKDQIFGTIEELSIAVMLSRRVMYSVGSDCRGQDERGPRNRLLNRANAQALVHKCRGSDASVFGRCAIDEF